LGTVRPSMADPDMVSQEKHCSLCQTHCLNVVADQLSRKGRALHAEWSLHPQIFQDICQIHGAPMINLFATRFNNKLPLFVSPVPDPKAIAVDAMSMDWAQRNCYVFPPTACISQVLRKLLKAPACKLMLVALCWPTKTWGTFPNASASKCFKALS
jgi:hypothetical protein